LFYPVSKEARDEIQDRILEQYHIDVNLAEVL